MDAAGGLNPVFITRHKAQGCTTPVVCGSEQGSATTILSDSVGIGIMLTMLITVYLSHDIAFSGPIWVTVVIELGALLMLMVFSHRRVSVMT